MNTIVCYLLLAGLIYISKLVQLKNYFTKCGEFPMLFFKSELLYNFHPVVFFFLLSRFDDSVYRCDSEFLSCMTPAKLSDNTFFLSNSDSLLKYLNVDLIDQDRSIKSFPYGSSLPKFSNVK